MASNLYYYREALGTEGAGGQDGWVKYQLLSDQVEVGRGNDLYEWSVLYTPTLTLVNSGSVTIGDGVDNIAGAGEAYEFRFIIYTDINRRWWLEPSC
ncbi:MAG: hypothetical protein U5K79_18110 [Cyclobacteriaceae bacterium]|nr:hypothetical protein [Cyclobacteriaceae bacterium]